MTKISKFHELIKNAHIEKDVESVYTQGITMYFPEAEIEHPFACDSFIDTKTDNGKMLKLIIEYKFDEDFSTRTARSKVIAQVLYYMKRFEQNGMILPNVVMVGDVNECFVFHSNDIIKYLDEDIDWTIAPSEAHHRNPDLVMKLNNDENVNPFIFRIDEHFSFKSVVERIKQLADNIQRYVHVTEHNIATIFEYFCDRVIKDRKKIQANDLVAVFMGVITKGENYYKHPNKKNTLVTPFGNISINSDGYDSFFSYFNRNYTPQEKNRFAEISDRLIEDTNRRNEGQFYTPTLFVDYAHKMIAEQFGEDWKEKYVVWDNSCFDDKTEFMSQNGWKLISDYKNGDKVLQFNQDGTTNFVTPIRYINQPYNGEWIDFKSSQMDIRTTSDHNYVVMSDKVQSGLWTKITAGELYEKSFTVKNLHKVIPTTFEYDGELEVDENIIRLAVAINADGSYRPKTTLGNNKGRTRRNTRFTELDTSVRDCYLVALKKERKKERLRKLLNEANLLYDEKTYGEYTHFTFHFPHFDAKHFPKEWYNLTRHCKEIIVDELFNWDGSACQCILPNNKTNVRKTYSTSKKDDADFIQFVFLTTGHGCYFRSDERKYEHTKVNYQLAMTNNKRTKLSNHTTSFSKIQSSEGDKCYCFQVDSGMLVVRRNNKVFISGNCGSKNLTRDYYFKELYSSTLEQAELDISSQYNKEATSFQFDFLNDPLEKLPQGLIEVFEQNKPIIFFMNPPYGRAGKSDDGVGAMGIKKGSTMTMVNEWMKKDKIGACSANLYAQFIYRIMMIKRQYKLTDCHIAMFTPTLYLAGPSWAGLRMSFFSDFMFADACTFKASHFADVADSWGIGFSIWKHGVNNNDIFNHKLIDIIDGEISTFGNKLLYNTDNTISGTKWASDVDIKKDKETLSLKSALNIGGKTLTTNDKVLSWFTNGCNNVDNNTQDVYIMSSPNDRGKTNIPVLPQNFTRCTSLFAARRLVQKNWINWTDEYMAPNTEHESWKEFESDSVVYSLFESKSNQSSLRNVEYKGKRWNIKNEFFWMSKDVMIALAEEYSNDYCYNDARVSNERYVYRLLQGMKLSKEARDVLLKATQIVAKSFPYRQMFNEEHPEYQVMNFDCGWYQVKAIAKEYLKDDLEEFKALYKKLSEKMLPMVYELGFLRK